jgi:hypothetical protein
MSCLLAIANTLTNSGWLFLCANCIKKRHMIMGDTIPLIEGDDPRQCECTSLIHRKEK